jgi:undecaprenyl-diphosphatase
MDPTPVPTDTCPTRLRTWAGTAIREAGDIDQAVYTAIARTPSPSIDEALRLLSNAANNSVLWFGLAGGLAVLGGRTGRRAALRGVAAIAVTSPIVNLGAKALHRRERPDRSGAGVPVSRHVRMPTTASFPSGHSASGFAFAGAVGHEIPALALPLRFLAAAVAYSRVHTGVHYPGDALVGSIVGGGTGSIVARAMDRAVRRWVRR